MALKGDKDMYHIEYKLRWQVQVSCNEILFARMDVLGRNAPTIREPVQLQRKPGQQNRNGDTEIAFKELMPYGP